MVFGILSTVWRFIGGPLVAVSIAFYFTPELQGYYYTFRNLLAIQVFVELGLSQVIIQFASHEWAHLGFDLKGEVVGDSQALSRLISLGRLAGLWYAVGAAVAAVALGLGGFLFFSAAPDAGGVRWCLPWLALCVTTGLDLSLLPVWSLLEGCNQVSEIYRYKFSEAVVTTPALVVAMMLGTGLWAPTVATWAKLAWAGQFLFRRYRAFLRPFLYRPTGPRISWRHEIWTLQWRIALSWLSGYFAYSLFTPVLFRYQGAVVAGQMGMTWQLVGVISQVSSLWALSRAPRFGILIEERKYAELDRLLARIVTVSSLVAMCGVVGGWSMVYALYAFKFRLAARLLPPLATAIFLGSSVPWQATLPLSVYLRAHKREPLLWISVVSGAVIGFSTWYLGSRFGATAMAVGYLIWNGIVAPVAVFWIWQRCRTAWHTPLHAPRSVSEALGS